MVFDRLKKFAESFRKTSEKLVDKLKEVIRLSPRIDDELFEQLEEALILADVGPAATMRILDQVRLRVKKEFIEGSDGVLRIIKEEMVNLLLAHPAPKLEGDASPFVTLIIGVNGTGKTTTIGKLAALFQAQGQSTILAAGDTFRAAAIEQLAIWAERSGADLIKSQSGSDPSSVAFDAIDAAVARGTKQVIVDTAGRLHTKSNLIEELKKIKRVIGKRLPGAPHLTLLVVDGTTGQNGISQAKLFNQGIGLDGLIMTKLDGTAKGGVIFGIVHELNLPVIYLGTGEKIGDLEVFDPVDFVDAIFEAEVR